MPNFLVRRKFCDLDLVSVGDGCIDIVVNKSFKRREVSFNPATFKT